MHVCLLFWCVVRVCSHKTISQARRGAATNNQPASTARTRGSKQVAQKQLARRSSWLVRCCCCYAARPEERRVVHGGSSGAVESLLTGADPLWLGCAMASATTTCWVLADQDKKESFTRDARLELWGSGSGLQVFPLTPGPPIPRRPLLHVTVHGVHTSTIRDQ
jgi:hypothetical protein